MRKLPFEIIFEDADILVIDKPAGLLTSTNPRERRPTALAAAREYLAATDRRAKIGLIHRLDRDASGLLVFSKNPRAFASLKRQFFNHTVDRVYLAVVSPPPKEKKGRIESSLVEWADGSVHSTRLRGRGQSAITDYSEISRNGPTAILRVKLLTGRKHQIRAHLSEKQFPIIGDTIYRGKPDKRGLMLAAVELSLDHPRTGERMEFRIDPPSRMKSGRVGEGERGRKEAKTPPSPSLPVSPSPPLHPRGIQSPKP
jgi:RluA family pseudouridine synthase